MPAVPVRPASPLPPARAAALSAAGRGRLAGFVVAVIVGHHVGTFVGPFGDAPGATRWADWVDLLTPYLVVGTALLTLLAAGAGRRTWVVAAVGAVVYVQGHGIHLAANSVGNARGNGAPVHLWDEVVGHYLWYAGLALLVLALARSFAVPRGPLAAVGAVLFGVTHATNGIEGGTAYASLAVAVGFCVGMRREPMIVLAYGVAAVVLVAWGAYWGLAEGRSFPQPSELGWI
jgi:hypothetical protein